MEYILLAILETFGKGPHNPIWWVLLITVPVVLFVIFRMTIWKDAPGLPSGRVATLIITAVIVIGLVSLAYIIWVGYETYRQGGFEQMRELYESRH